MSHSFKHQQTLLSIIPFVESKAEEIFIMHAVLQVHEATISAGAYPSPLNYFHFPKSVCTSVNEVCAQPRIHQLWSKAQLRIEHILCQQHTLCCLARCLTTASAACGSCFAGIYSVSICLLQPTTHLCITAWPDLLCHGCSAKVLLRRSSVMVFQTSGRLRMETLSTLM